MSRDLQMRLTAACGLLCLWISSANADSVSRFEPTAVATPSIHALELDTWKDRQAAGWMPPAGRPSGAFVPLVPRAQAPTREVHGYHPYWMGTSYDSYDWSLLTTVVFFALELDGQGDIVADHGWPWNDLVATAHQNGVRVLATAVLFSSSELDLLLASPARRQNAIANLVAAINSAGADGINVDFEGVPGSRKQDLVTFLGDLQAALDAAVPNSYLSIATPAVDWSNAFDYDALAARCDHLAVMAYDYHWSGSPTTGPVAPIDGWSVYNVTWTVQDYKLWGAPADKILLGAPYYGYRWQAVSEAAGAATLASGVARTFVQADPEAQQSESLWDEASSTPWYRDFDSTWNQGWYDNAASLASKYDLVGDENLAGISIWALGYDGSRPELWAALADAFGPTPVAIPERATQGNVQLVRVAPNPFRATTHVELVAFTATPARLHVYDVRGHRVRSLFEGVVGAQRRIVWDGYDDHGRSSPAGIYWMRLNAAGSARTVRVVRLH